MHTQFEDSGQESEPDMMGMLQLYQTRNLEQL